MHKLGIIVPYRKREAQLKKFLKHIQKFLKKSNIQTFCIIVVDQIDRKKFNRGKLLNIGFIEAEKKGCDYVVFHDVDMLPTDVSYEYSDKPLQLANVFINDGDFTRSIQRNYFGGATLFTVKDFKSVNGYSNKYKGWGFEDDDLLLRCREVGLELEKESYRTLDFDKRLLYFNGKNSFVKIKNNFITVRPYSYVATFFPEPIECNPSEITDEFAVFGIPGEDLNLSYNSFSTYKFETFLNNSTPVSITSDYSPNLPLQAVININPKLNRMQFFLNGKEVGSKYCHKKLKDYRPEPFLYLGVADPNRKTKQKYFKGYISNFGIIHGELSLQEVRKLFRTNPNKSLSKENSFLEGRWYSYYDSLNYSKLKGLVLDDSGRFNHGVYNNVKLKSIKTGKVTKIQFPYRRKGIFQLIKHKEAGYTDGFWKDWSSRENQLRYYRLVNSKNSGYTTDGLTTCKYKHSIENINKLVTIVKATT